MIRWSNSRQCYIVSGRPDFDNGTYERAVAHAQALRGSCLNWGDRWLTSYDLQAATTGSNAGMHLCHQVSINLIEQIIVEYLNGEIDAPHFLAYTGVVLSPSYLVLSAPRTFLAWFADWGLSTLQRFDVIVQANRGGRSPQQVADAANLLAQRLNNASLNLRYGGPSTNMSIGSRLDLRIRRGFSLEPLAIAEQLYGLFTGRPVLAIESSAVLNTLRGVAQGAQLSEVNGGLKMSTQSQQIGQTRSGNAIHGAQQPVHSPWRGPVHPYVQIDRAYLGNLILILILYYTFSWMFR